MLVQLCVGPLLRYCNRRRGLVQCAAGCVYGRGGERAQMGWEGEGTIAQLTSVGNELGK